QANVSAPTRVQLVKRGKYALLYVSSAANAGGAEKAKGQELPFSGAAARLAFEGPFYIGIGVCSHNKDTIEKAGFSNVELNTSLSPPSRPPVLYSTLETQVLSSTDRRVVYVTPSRIEAPNWLRDGKSLIYNS